jgi:transcription elongation GreA/GreB family factor
MIRFAEARGRGEKHKEIKTRKAKAEAEATLKEKANGWKKAQAEIHKETLLEEAISRGHCYLEHPTNEEKVECGKKWKHMRYDEEADYGFFE